MTLKKKCARATLEGSKEWVGITQRCH